MEQRRLGDGDGSFAAGMRDERAVRGSTADRGLTGLDRVDMRSAPDA